MCKIKNVLSKLIFTLYLLRFWLVGFFVGFTECQLLLGHSVPKLVSF